MHIAGRLALQSPACAVLPQRETGIAPNPEILSFHGCDVVVRHITEHGFEADLSTTLVEGALVRLRLPGAGAMIARVKSASPTDTPPEEINTSTRGAASRRMASRCPGSSATR